jgi:uncharacterized membrane protein YfcA
MQIQTILILLLIGVIAGVLSGLVGVGGGIVIVPSLVFFLGFSQKMAQGTSIGILLLPVGILGVLQFYKAGYINMNAVWLVSLGFLVGGYFGSKIALSLPQDTLKKTFAIILLLVSLKILFLDKKIKETSNQNAQVNNSITNAKR